MANFTPPGPSPSASDFPRGEAGKIVMEHKTPGCLIFNAFYKLFRRRRRSRRDCQDLRTAAGKKSGPVRSRQEPDLSIQGAHLVQSSSVNAFACECEPRKHCLRAVLKKYSRRINHAG